MIIFAILGGLIAVASFAVGLWSGITILVLIFRRSVAWGCATFIPIIAPFAWLAFIISNWEDTKRPFLINLAATGGMMVGGMLVALGAPGMIGSAPGDPFATDTAYSDSGTDIGTGANDPFSDDSDVADFFSEPTPTPFRPTAVVLNRSPIPTRTPRLPTPTPFPSPTPLPIERLAEHAGRYLELTLTNGDSFQALLVKVEGDQVTIERRLGGGSIRFTVQSSEIDTYRVLR